MEANMRSKLVPELICSDLGISLNFYQEILGFQILYDRPEERFAFLDRNGAQLMLEQPSTMDRLWPRANFTQPYGRGINFEIQVEDATAIYQTVCNAGLPIFLPLEVRWYRRDSSEIGVRQFAVQDPDGYLLRLSQPLGTRDRMAGRTGQ